MAATLGARAFEPRVTQAHKRASVAQGRLRWAVVVMALLNALVWGGMIAAGLGLIDVHQLVDQAWAQGAAWVAAIPRLSLAISH